ncbi:hypothetical protein [Candidatus Cardinium sp. TP]|uniref:hypothetical protein n=1 Tax=Candidatus Cardinium sp. TP TaxID=2961955 RepID=UPI0021AF71EA|nr:hypothetical protein [Candidatus Cardinium sp. TP]MCT4697393.1 hypothetical protein [Candidatus Cardinium sp. TP]MDN5247326.1 hypothetical protein [Candidatus Cardinium sp.]
MFLLKLKADNKLNRFYFLFSLLLLFSCCSGTKGTFGFDVLNPNISKMKKSIKNIDVQHSTSVESYWDKTLEKGFLSDKKTFDPNKNNELELGLGYIFFNTLRAKLSNEKNVNHANPQIWNNKIKNAKGFKCPKPWKYKVIETNNDPCGIFYLDCVQMGEYFYDDKSIPFRNFDKIYNEGKNNGKAPYMKVYYADNNQETSDDFILNIDHLLRDNSYLIELPKILHNLKTDYLDTFIPGPSQTGRSMSASTYWRNREDYLDVRSSYIRDNNFDINPCMCRASFQLTGNIINDHIHNNPWGKDWTAKMMRDNVVLSRR